MRMPKSILQHLITALVEIGGLNPKLKRIPIEESLAFLLIVGQGCSYPVVEERLQHSSETVSKHFHMILDVVCKLGDVLLKLKDPTFSNLNEDMLLRKKCWPAFKDCIGAIDGTHIGVHIPDGMKLKWINRKGFTSTNVLAICDFDLHILFAWVGMEGSMHDARVLWEAIGNMSFNFPIILEGKYLFADAGYALSPGFLTPYRSVRYHLQEYASNRNIVNRDDLFNYRHSTLRTCIERTFGMIKKRWRALVMMPHIPLDAQLKVIWACFALHNFIKMYDSSDDELIASTPNTEDIHHNSYGASTSTSVEDEIYEGPESCPNMAAMRDYIRDSLPNIRRRQ